MKKYKILIFIGLLVLVSCSSDDENVVDIVNQAPNSFDLIKVADGSINIDVLPEFTWQAATDPDGDVVSYDLYLDTEANPTTLYKDNLASPNLKVQERLFVLNDYYWKVIAKDSNGNTTESSVSHFTTRNLNFYNNPVTAAAAFSARSEHTTVVYDNKLWVIGGFESSVFQNDVWYSNDGETWTQANFNSSIRFSRRTGHTTVTHQNKLWVIGGFDENSKYKNDVWYSSDGVSWTEATSSAPFSGRYNHTTVVYDDKFWIIGGLDENSKYKNDVWYSSDGVSWTEATSSAPFSGRYNHTTDVYDNKLWLIGGYANGNEFNDVWFSSDGFTWTGATASAQFSKRYSHTTVVYDDKLWLIGGYDKNNNHKNDVWFSSDGTNWIKANNAAPFSGRLGHSATIYDNKLWLIGGQDGSDILNNDVWLMD